MDGILRLNVGEFSHLFVFAPNGFYSQQSFTFPTETAHPAGERPGEPSGGQSEVEGAAASRATRAEHGGAVRTLSSEEAQQAFLSRLLLMLGSFVVLCLVLF